MYHSKTMKNYYAISILCLLISCSTVDEKSIISSEQNKDQFSDAIPKLLINEFVTKGDEDSMNAFGCDWIEIYNADTFDVDIKSNEWTLTDDDDHMKWSFSDTILKPGEFLIIFCDDNEDSELKWHANFKLSNKDERIGLFFNGLLADEVIIEEKLKKHESYGRSADGNINWEVFNLPSVGKSNSSTNNYAESL